MAACYMASVRLYSAGITASCRRAENPVPAVSIIIPVFNQLQYTRGCLEAIQANTSAVDYDLIVVDNGSSDATAAYLAERQAADSRLQVISYRENRGFSRANNDAAVRSQAEHLLFLNNDTLPQPGWLDEMLLTAARPRVGVVGAKLLFPESLTINHAGYVYNREMRVFYPIYHGYSADLPAVNKEREYQAVLGACLLIKRSLFLQVGMFADFGLEDIDLCLKVRAQGRRVIYCPKSVVLHYGSITLHNSPPGAIPQMDTRLFNQHWPPAEIPDDDRYYYERDGFDLLEITPTSAKIRERVSTSYEVLLEGLELRKQGRMREAEERFRLALKVYRYNHDVYLEMIALYVEERRLDEAIAASRELMELVPDYLNGRLLAARLLARKGDLPEARCLLRTLLEHEALTGDLKEKAEELLTAWERD